MKLLRNIKSVFARNDDDKNLELAKKIHDIAAYRPGYIGFVDNDGERLEYISMERYTGAIDALRDFVTAYDTDTLTKSCHSIAWQEVAKWESMQNDN